jgi:transketolase
VKHALVGPGPWGTVTAPFSRALLDIGAQRDDVVVLVGDLMHWTDTAAFAEAYPGRFFQVGMAEQNLLGIGAGMAKSGLVPIIVTYGVFATRRAYDQLAMGLCTGANTHAVVAGFLPGITSPFRATHQGIDDVALMRVLPRTAVVDPMDATETVAWTKEAVETPGVTYLRLQRRQVVSVFDPDLYRPSRSEAVTVRDGADLAVISSGLGTLWALEAADLLAARGVAARLVHVPSIKPLPEEDLAQIAQQFPVVHVVENHSAIGGLRSAMAELVADRGLGTRLIGHNIGTDWPGRVGRIDYLRGELGLDAPALAASLAADAERRTAAGVAI